jgi:hypothetical protein
MKTYHKCGSQNGDSSRYLVSSIKGEVKKKHISVGWNFSCFAAHLIERDLYLLYSMLWNSALFAVILMVCHLPPSSALL